MIMLGKSNNGGIATFDRDVVACAFSNGVAAVNGKSECPLKLVLEAVETIPKIMVSSRNLEFPIRFVHDFCEISSGGAMNKKSISGSNMLLYFAFHFHSFLLNFVLAPVHSQMRELLDFVAFGIVNLSVNVVVIAKWVVDVNSVDHVFDKV